MLKFEVTYLGHLISEEGVKRDPEKLNALITRPVPRDVKVRAFLRLTGYYPILYIHKDLM